MREAPHTTSHMAVQVDCTGAGSDINGKRPKDEGRARRMQRLLDKQRIAVDVVVVTIFATIAVRLADRHLGYVMGEVADVCALWRISQRLVLLLRDVVGF